MAVKLPTPLLCSPNAFTLLLHPACMCENDWVTCVSLNRHKMLWHRHAWVRISLVFYLPSRMCEGYLKKSGCSQQVPTMQRRERILLPPRRKMPKGLRGNSMALTNMAAAGWDLGDQLAAFPRDCSMAPSGLNTPVWPGGCQPKPMHTRLQERSIRATVRAPILYL